MDNIENLNVKIFADGANYDDMVRLYKNPLIKGLTTNPTLMKNAGIQNFEKFCREVLETINDKPISFEVFSDHFDEMKRQAKIISSWGDNVYVKIPISNSTGDSSLPLISDLSADGIKVNVTAIMTQQQIEGAINAIGNKTRSYISIFAGRIADTGKDPIPVIEKTVKYLSEQENIEIIWASPRELLNIFHADQSGCHVITVTPDIINKIDKIGYDLELYSLDTVRMFQNDALEAGYSL